MIGRVWTLLRHAWMDAGDSRRLLPPEAFERIGQRVTDSERSHSGEIRVVVEAALPMSYCWRHAWHATALEELAHQRAMMLFGRLRVWDTAQNNGVLIYLLLAEHRIVVIADRGLNDKLSAADWQTLVARLSSALSAGQFEAGLRQSVDEVSTLLVRHFAAAGGGGNPNELADRPLRI